MVKWKLTPEEKAERDDRLLEAMARFEREWSREEIYKDPKRREAYCKQLKRFQHFLTGVLLATIPLTHIRCEADKKLEQVIQKASGEDCILSVDEANTLVERLGYNGPQIQEGAGGNPSFNLNRYFIPNVYEITVGRHIQHIEPRVIDDYLGIH